LLIVGHEDFSNLLLELLFAKRECLHDRDLLYCFSCAASSQRDLHVLGLTRLRASIHEHQRLPASCSPYAKPFFLELGHHAFFATDFSQLFDKVARKFLWVVFLLDGQ
jgi:hypothetical protein